MKPSLRIQLAVPSLGVFLWTSTAFGAGPTPTTPPEPTPTYVLNTWTMEKIYTFDAKFGTKGSGMDQLDDPEGLWVGSDDNLYIADTNNNRVLVWNTDGKPIKSIGSFGTAAVWQNPPQFDHPMGVLTLPSGQMYVADTLNARIVELGTDGLVVLSWGHEGTRRRQFSMPRTVAQDHYGNIWVLDSDNSRVQNFTAAGKFNFMWGHYGSQQGLLNLPLGMALNFIDQGIIADTGNFRIQVFNDKSPAFIDTSAPVTNDDQTGAVTQAPTPIPTPDVPVTVEGWYGDGPAQFKEPGGVCVTKTGWVAVTDGLTGRVIFLNNRFEFRGQWKDTDEDLKLPVTPHFRAIGCDSQNRLYVTDIANNCVIRLSLMKTEAMPIIGGTPLPTAVPTPTPVPAPVFNAPYEGGTFPIR